MDLARGTAAAEGLAGRLAGWLAGQPARPDSSDGASLCLQPREPRDLSVPGNSKLSMKLRNLLSNQPPHTEGWWRGSRGRRRRGGRRFQLLLSSLGVCVHRVRWRGAERRRGKRRLGAAGAQDVLMCWEASVFGVVRGLHSITNVVNH